MGLNLASLLTNTAERHPDEVAVKLGDLAVGYAMLDQLSSRAATLLRDRGIEPGDRVGVMLPTVPQFPIAYYGALKAGAVVVPMNPLLKEREVGYLLSDAGAKLLIGWEDFLEPARAGAGAAGVGEVLAATRPGGDAAGLPRIEEEVAACEPASDLVQREPGDPAVIIYTSGTTGQPKGACLTHSNMSWNAYVFSRLVGLEPGDVILGVLPLFHSFGQTAVMNAGFAAGVRSVLLPRFDPEAALDLFEGEGVTGFFGVPTMYTALLQAQRAKPRRIEKLKWCASGAAPLAVETLREAEEVFGCPVLEGYGLSETSPVVSFNQLDRPSKPGSIGTPMWGVEMKVVDDAGEELPPGEVGEIVIRGHCVMQGYWNRPEESAKAIDERGWLHSGDLARVDEDGYFFIVDRKKDLIIRGGLNVYPRDVEEVLYEHPAVALAAVVGMPDPSLGEEVGAVVVLKDGQRAEPEELVEWVKERVAAYKYPRRVAIADELPIGPSGKIVKREIDVEGLLGATRIPEGV